MPIRQDTSSASFLRNLDEAQAAGSGEGKRAWGLKARAYEDGAGDGCLRMYRWMVAAFQRAPV